MYEWLVEYSQSASDEKTISCSVSSATVYADTIAEVREIMAEEVPDAAISKITLIG